MKPGGGKQKGADFEREVCKKLSLWVTSGEKKDCFWRSAMSGGRATVAQGDVRQAGDICAVAPEGHSLTNRFYIECKTYKDLMLPKFFLEGGGILSQFWAVALVEAVKYDKEPILIAKQKMFPIMFIAPVDAIGKLTSMTGPLPIATTRVWRDGIACDVHLFDDVLAAPYDSGRVRLQR